MTRALLKEDDVISLVKHMYGLQVKQQTTLNSYDDVNVHILVKDNHLNPYLHEISKYGYVLKVLNEVDSKKKAFVGAMHEAIKRVSQAGIPTSLPVPDLHGNQYFLKQLRSNSGEEGHKFLVRLFQYVPGEMLDGKTLTPQLCFEVGQLAGRLDKALKGFENECLANHSRHWNLTEVVRMGDKIPSIADLDHRQLVVDVVEQFDKKILKQAHILTKGVIHADLNEGNIIVKESDHSNNQHPIYHVHGVLDFGDLVHEFLVYEIAITMTYMMIESGDLDPFEAAGHTLAGYALELTLPPVDLNVLKECIAARMAQSFTYGAHVHKLDPSNTYCLRTQRTGWSILKKLWAMPKSELYQYWANILHQYNLAVDFGQQI